MRGRKWGAVPIIIAVLLLLAALWTLLGATLGGLGAPDAASTGDTAPPQVLPSPSPATLEHVVDGDTIDVRIGETRERVRLIGIDTPERGQLGAAEATARLEALLAGVALYLEADTSERDRYARLLRYVWTRDAAGAWTLINLVLVDEGLTAASPYPPNEKYADRFSDAEAIAQAEQRGIWTPPPATAPEPEPEATTPSEQCDPSYPGVCIPPPPPDLDCGQITFRRFQVVGSDPHRFDTDRDGIGCES